MAIIGRLDLLKQRYGRLLIPPAVAVELAALSHSAGKLRIQAALAEGWIVVERPPATTPRLSMPLDVGETEAINLALAMRADVLLVDEKRGREAARQNGVAVAGVLGELLHAKHKGWISNLRDEIKLPRAEAGFFIDLNIEEFVLSQAGE